MASRRGPRADQIDQGTAISGDVLTAGVEFPSFQPSSGGGGTGGTDVQNTLPVQDVIRPNTITSIDGFIDTALSMEPFDVESVIVFLNGVAQVQGEGSDYQIVEDTSGDISIFWLAGTGTAVNLTSLDRIMVYYWVAV